jgi:hypothetical protein
MAEPSAAPVAPEDVREKGVTRRLLLACALFSVWFVGLLGGVALGGAIHLALVAAVAAFPWKAVR